MIGGGGTGAGTGILLTALANETTIIIHRLITPPPKILKDASTMLATPMPVINPGRPPCVGTEYSIGSTGITSIGGGGGSGASSYGSDMV
jgi:hypothetical protein